MIGDSYGAERKLHYHKGDDLVEPNQAWPYLTKLNLVKDYRIETDFKPFRLLDESIDIIYSYLNQNETVKLVIIHAGVCDAFPRPLPKTIFRSKSFICRVIRRSVRLVRQPWMKFIYCMPNVSIQTLSVKLMHLLAEFPDVNFSFFEIPYSIHPEALQTPLQKEYIQLYNKRIKNIQFQKSNFNFIDFYEKNSDKILCSLDSHLNKKGNTVLSDFVSNYISEYFVKL